MHGHAILREAWLREANYLEFYAPRIEPARERWTKEPVFFRARNKYGWPQGWDVRLYTVYM